MLRLFIIVTMKMDYKVIFIYIFIFIYSFSLIYSHFFFLFCFFFLYIVFLILLFLFILFFKKKLIVIFSKINIKHINIIIMQIETLSILSSIHTPQLVRLITGFCYKNQYPAYAGLKFWITIFLISFMRVALLFTYILELVTWRKRDTTSVSVYLIFFLVSCHWFASLKGCLLIKP